MSWFDAYSLRFSGFTPNQRAYVQPGYRSQHFTYWRPSGGAQQTPLLALLDIDLQDYLPDYVLRKADLCAMAHGLELGAPRLTMRGIKTCSRCRQSSDLPLRQKCFARTRARHVKHSDCSQKKKLGFNAPLQQWLQKDLAERLSNLGERLESVTTWQLDASAVNAMVRHYGGGAEHMAEQILQLLILDESLRQLLVLAGES